MRISDVSKKFAIAAPGKLIEIYWRPKAEENHQVTQRPHVAAHPVRNRREEGSIVAAGSASDKSETDIHCMESFTDSCSSVSQSSMVCRSVEP